MSVHWICCTPSSLRAHPKKDKTDHFLSPASTFSPLSSLHFSLFISLIPPSHPHPLTEWYKGHWKQAWRVVIVSTNNYEVHVHSVLIIGKWIFSVNMWCNIIVCWFTLKIKFPRISSTKSTQVGGVRACNSVKFETGQNLPPLLRIVICAV